VFHNEIQQAVQFLRNLSACILELLLCGKTGSHIQKAQDRFRSTDDVGQWGEIGGRGYAFIAHLCLHKDLDNALARIAPAVARPNDESKEI
jgi:hypothetical protein